MFSSKFPNPVDFVAPEIWEIIFEKLQSLQQHNNYYNKSKSLSGNDLLSCSRVCITFRNILSGTKSLWLFEEILPFLTPYFSSINTILSIRATCKLWKFSVDHYLENYSYYDRVAKEKGRIRNPQFYAYSLLPRNNHEKYKVIVPTCTIHSIRDIGLFYKIMNIDNIIGNPFPGGKLRLDCKEVQWENIETFWHAHVNQLLSRFGHHVRILCLKLIDDYNGIRTDLSYIKYRDQVLAILPLVCNLRKLCVEGNISRGWYQSPNSQNSQLTEISSSMLPLLECIEFSSNIYITNVQDFPLPFSLQKTIYAPFFLQLQRLQLSILEINYRFPKWGCQTGNNHNSSNATNLEELRITVVSTRQLLLFLNFVKNSPKLRSVFVDIDKLNTDSCRACLGHYYIDQGEYEREWRIRLYDFIVSLQRYFSKSLCSLIVILPPCLKHNSVTTQEDLNILCEFSRLKYLHIEGFKFWELKVIGNLPASLEFLMLAGKPSRRKNPNGSTEVEDPGISIDLPCGNSIKKSKSFWKYLPFLKLLSIEEDWRTFLIYRRKGF